MLSDLRLATRAFDDRDFINWEENISSPQFASRHCRDRTETPKQVKSEKFFLGRKSRLTKCN